jgi:hypothetical protein
MKLTNLKAIVSGNVVEIFSYEKPLAYDFSIPSSKRVRDDDEDERPREKKEDVRKRSMYRARSLVTRLIYSNVWQWKQDGGEAFPPAFITFTFAENLTDIEKANEVFTLFIKRLNFQLFKSKKSILKYITVTEFQKRGAVHFHCLFFNLPIGLVESERTTRRIAHVWGHGFIDTKDVTNIDKAIRYLTKYMLKGFEDPRLDGKKRYFTSRKMHQSKVIRLQHLVEKMLLALPSEKKVYENTFDNEYQGMTTYSKYQLDRGQLLRLKKEEIRSTIPINNPLP